MTAMKYTLWGRLEQQRSVLVGIDPFVHHLYIWLKMHVLYIYMFVPVSVPLCVCVRERGREMVQLVAFYNRLYDYSTSGIHSVLLKPVWAQGRYLMNILNHYIFFNCSASCVNILLSLYITNLKGLNTLLWHALSNEKERSKLLWSSG